jgi:hypothetical protein
LVERSPEKAGVGGSIPSLATIISTVYKAPLRHFHPNSFQNHGARVRRVWKSFRQLAAEQNLHRSNDAGDGGLSIRNYGHW